jgi:hypothetical protein
VLRRSRRKGSQLFRCLVPKVGVCLFW